MQIEKNTTQTKPKTAITNHSKCSVGSTIFIIPDQSKDFVDPENT